MTGRGSWPIAAYGLLGDTRSAALVAPDGAVDWLCTPRFDGDPVFGALVGGADAGTFRAGPAGPPEPADRRYDEGTATLVTTWPTGLRLTEGMVAEVAGRLLPPTLLVRRLTATDGPADATVLVDPRRGERRLRPSWRSVPGRLVCTWGDLALAVGTDPPLDLVPGRPVTVAVEPGRHLTLSLSVAHREPLVHVPPDRAWAELCADARRWRVWCAGIAADPVRPAEHAAVVRSLLTLRLLTYSPSGAPVAAPTTSLPEQSGGQRNWDYRYTWPRDACLGVAAFLGAGMPGEARRFLAWLLHASRLDRPRLPPLLTLHGRPAPPEREWSGWPGYAGSLPVRGGNDAARQHQLDTYGWVLDAGWRLHAAGHRLDSETWRALRGFADRVAELWDRPDHGIWEKRRAPAHYVHSKLMAWLALDRALRIAGTRGAPGRQQRRWRDARTAVADSVHRHGVDPARRAFVRAYGRTDLDAAVLLPMLDVEPPGSPLLAGTVDAVRRELSAGGPLLYRYAGDDGLPGGEGAFLACSFWLVEALARTGDVRAAEDLLGALLDLASPLGLYGEELDPAGGAHLGNYPQALTHAALVQAVFAVRAARRPAVDGPRLVRCGDA